MQKELASAPASLAFLERARDEVLNAVNHTSGTQFFEAGSHYINGLYAAAFAQVVAMHTMAVSIKGGSAAGTAGGR